MHQVATPKREHEGKDQKEQEQACQSNAALGCTYGPNGIQSFVSPAATRYVPTFSPPVFLPFQKDEERTPTRKNNSITTNKRRRRHHLCSSSFQKPHGESGILADPHAPLLLPLFKDHKLGFFVDRDTMLANDGSWRPPLSRQAMLQPRRKKFRER